MTVLDAFLADRPEFRPDAATLAVDGRPEDVLTLDGTLAFIEWATERKLCDPAKAAGVRAALTAKFGGRP